MNLTPHFLAVKNKDLDAPLPIASVDIIDVDRRARMVTAAVYRAVEREFDSAPRDALNPEWPSSEA